MCDFCCSDITIKSKVNANLFDLHPNVKLNIPHAILQNKRKLYVVKIRDNMDIFTQV